VAHLRDDIALDPAEWISIPCPKCGYVITNCSRQGMAHLFLDSVTHELCGYQGPLEFHNPELAGFVGEWFEITPSGDIVRSPD
jgi:predicted RNA-binding Zn-ribbon protein involved in translation (DUF1610 family)